MFASECTVCTPRICLVGIVCATPMPWLQETVMTASMRARPAGPPLGPGLGHPVSRSIVGRNIFHFPERRMRLLGKAKIQVSRSPHGVCLKMTQSWKG